MQHQADMQHGSFCAHEHGHVKRKVTPQAHVYHTDTRRNTPVTTSRQEVGIETPRWHCEAQALLNCWCVPTGMASAYFLVAMVNSHGRLYLVNRRGTVRGHRLYFRSTYHEGRKSRHKAETAKALKASQDKATPPLHFQGPPGCSNGLLRHWAQTVCKPHQPARTVSAAIHCGRNPWRMG